MIDFIISHPLYLPFILINIFIIYKVIKDVRSDDKGRDDEDGGIITEDDPILDLPPGVTLPVRPKEPILVE